MINIPLSENNEELELKCEKLAEEMAERSSTSGEKRSRKRKRTEKGQDWDESIEKELAPPKQIAIEQPSVSEPSPKQVVDTEVPTQTGIVADKHGKNAPKQKNVVKPSTKKKSAAREKKEGDKSGETRSKKAIEKEAQKTAEIECRKSLATDFFKVAETGKQNNFTNEDMTHINHQTGQENGDMTAEHNSARNGHMTSLQCSSSNLESRQVVNRKTSEEQDFTDRETMTPRPNYSQVTLTKRQEYHTPVNAYPSINDATIRQASTATKMDI